MNAICTFYVGLPWYVFASVSEFAVLFEPLIDLISPFLALQISIQYLPATQTELLLLPRLFHRVFPSLYTFPPIFSDFFFSNKTPPSFLTLHYSKHVWLSWELLHQTMMKLTLITTVIYRLHLLTNFSSFLQTEDSRTLCEQTGLLPPTATW